MRSKILIAFLCCVVFSAEGQRNRGPDGRFVRNDDQPVVQVVAPQGVANAHQDAQPVVQVVAPQDVDHIHLQARAPRNWLSWKILLPASVTVIVAAVLVLRFLNTRNESTGTSPTFYDIVQRVS